MTTNKSRQGAVLEPETTESSTCRHHWVIDSPAGPVSNGICRLCGEVREFRNSLEDSYWRGDDVTLGHVSTGGRIPVSMNLGGVDEAEDGS